jgi:hypothetical protein
MARPDRDFKGVWIPKEIWLSGQLSLMEKVLFVEIHSLDNARGCFASNKYFAEFFGIHPRRIAAHISSLKAKGFVTVTVQNQNELVIRVVGKYARVKDAVLRQFEEDKQKLIHKLRNRDMGGMTETS